MPIIYQYFKKFKYNPNNADLFFNRASIFSYLQNYDKAIEDYNKAIELDKNLGSLEKINFIKENLEIIILLINQKGKIKPKKLEKIIKQVPKTFQNKDILSFQDFENKDFKDKLFCGKISNFVSQKNNTPKILIVIDKNCCFGIISIFNINDEIYEKIKLSKSLVYIYSPNIKKLEVNRIDLKNKIDNEFIYNIQVDQINSMKIDNIPLVNFFSKAEIFNTNF